MRTLRQNALRVVRWRQQALRGIHQFLLIVCCLGFSSAAFSQTLVNPDNDAYSIEWGATDGVIEVSNIVDQFLAGDITVEELVALSEAYFNQIEPQGWFYPTYTDGCNGESGLATITSQVLSGSADVDCPMVAQVIWTFAAIDECGNVGPETWTTTCDFFDTTPPVILNVPADVTVACLEEVPAQVELVSEDSCDPTVVVQEFVAQTDTFRVCELSDAVGAIETWALWLPQLEAAGVADDQNFLWDAGGTWVEFLDGTAEVSGTVRNAQTPSQAFEVYMKFHTKQNWTDWSGAGRSYKNETNSPVALAEHINWDYYKLVDGLSSLTGIEDYLGSNLSLGHNPPNHYFGFQCGIAANNKNDNLGMSGWFTYAGVVADVAINGHGDINVDKECGQPQDNAECIHDQEITYYWFAIDDCGNATVATQVVTVFDDVLPTFDNPPADLVLECTDLIPDAPMLTATDNCMQDVIDAVYLGETETGDSCERIITRAWIATDDCGNVGQWSQTITIRDTTAPVPTFFPEDLDEQCNEDVVLEDPIFEDACNMVTVLPASSIALGACENQYVQTRTWTVSDNCGNSEIYTQIITVNDDTAPVFDAYDVEVSVECDELDTVEILTATDNCEGDVTIEFVDSEMSGPCLPAIMRTYTATDACGNSATAFQFIMIQDTTPPTIEHPADITVECDAVPVYDLDDILAEDACGLDVDVDFTSVRTDGDCPYNYVITYTWTAVDYCNNEHEETTVVTVQDTTAPMTPMAPADVLVECAEDIPAPVDLTATDNCSGDITVSPTAVITPGDCDNRFVMVRTWTFVDECMQTSSVSQTITVDDTTKPDLVIPGDLTVECDAVPEVGMASATDNCDSGATVAYDGEERVDGNCAYNYTLLRTWTASDICGNDSTATQTITVQDTTAPVWDLTCQGILSWNTEDGSVCPADAMISLEVGDEIDVFTGWTVGGEEVLPVNGCVSDNCSADENLTIRVKAKNESSTETCFRILTITLEAEDECGNVEGDFTCTYQFTDNTAPIANAPADEAYQCAADVPAAGELTATDNCQADITVTGTDTDNGGAGCMGDPLVITRTWDFNDGCGNTTSVSQTITVMDTIKPDLTVPADLTVECDAVPPVNSGDGAIAGFVGDYAEANWVISTDGSDGSITISETEMVVTGNDNGDGNVSVQATALCPAAGVFSFDWDFLSGDEDGASYDPAFYINGELVQLSDDDGDLAQTGSLSVQCEAGDEIGFAIIATDGVFGAGLLTITNFTVGAGGDGTSASDNCDAVSINYDGEVRTDGDCPYNYTLTRTWTATDACGNDSTAFQTINVEDTTAPTIDTPAMDMTVECDGAGNTMALEAWLASNGGAIASDNCGMVTWSNDYTMLSDDCGVTGSATVTFTATDECMNATPTTATFTIEDTTAPTIDTPAMDMTVECDGAGNTMALEAWLASNGGAVASDVCGGVVWSNDYVMLSDDCGATGSATVTFTATDDCLNATPTTATFTIEDTTDPDLTIPADLTVECDAVPSVVSGDCDEIFIDGAITVADFSGAETLINFDDFDLLGTEVQSITGNEYAAQGVQFSFDNGVGTIGSEHCGSLPFSGENTLQNFNCDDFPNQLDNFSILFNEKVNRAGVQISTNAGDDVVISIQCKLNGNVLDEIQFSTALNFEFYGIESATGFDEIRLESIVAVNGAIIIDDLRFEGCEGGSDGTSAADSCGDVTISYDGEVRTDGDCPHNYTLTRTWTATDDCGNDSTAFQTINVQDTTAPTIDTPAMDMTVECDGAGNTMALEAWLASNGGAVASDVCGGVVWSNDYVMLSDDCGETGSATVTFTATDDCLNATPTTATFTIEDTTAPTIDTPAMDMTVECDGAGNTMALEAWLASNGGAAASDDCSGVVWSNDYDMLSDDCGATGSATVTFTATDDCLNATPTTATFTIEDTTAPTIDTPAMNMTVECDGDGNTAQLEAWLASYGGAIASDVCGGVTWSSDCESAVSNFEIDCIIDGDLLTTITYGEPNGIDPIGFPTYSGTSIEFPTLVYVLYYNHDLGQWEGTENGTLQWFSVTTSQTPPCDASEWVESNFLICNMLEVRCSSDNAVCELSDECGATGSVTVTFTATDDCLNATPTTATFTIEDTTAPTIDTPAMDMTVECDGAGNTMALEAWLASNGGAAASDDCSGVVWSNDYAMLSDDCGETGSATVTFTATDDCLNATPTTATFTIEDTTAPTIDTPAMDMTVECDGDGNTMALEAWLASNGGATASDVCGGVVWSNDFMMLSDDCGATGSATVTFTATDDCLNATPTTATFTIEDTTDPDLTIPADLTVECDAVPPVNSGDGAVAGFVGDYAEANWVILTDGSDGSVTISETELVVTGNDNGDNNVSVQATALCPAAGIFSFDWDFVSGDTDGPSYDPAFYINGDLVALSDDNGDVLQSGSLSVQCEAGDEIGFAIIATDGILGAGLLTITNFTVGAGGDGTSAADSCGDVSIAYDGEERIDGDCDYNYTLLRTWTATDDCGNDSTATQTITVQDTTAPVPPMAPADEAYQCVEDVPAAMDLTATDNCFDDITVVAVVTDNGGAGCEDDPLVITRTWTFVDGCMNAADPITQTVTVIDDINPTVEGEPEVELSCELKDDEAAILSQITVMDNCDDDVDVTYEAFELSTGFCAGRLIVTFFATDDCGNTTIFEQNIILIDNTPPVITGPAALEEPCDNMGMPIFEVTDNCDTNPDVVVDEVMVSTGNCAGTVIRTITATDACGNESMLEQIVTLIDEVDPTWDELPIDMNVECGDALPTEAPTASDNCDDDVDVTFEDVVTTSDMSCIENNVITRTWTATDHCDNSIETVQVFTIVDTTDPMFVGNLPGDTTIECQGDFACPTDITATDVCGDATVSCNPVYDLDDCGNGTITVTLTALDACGNDVDYTYTVTVLDTTAPVFNEEEPEDLVLNCNAEVPAAPVFTATDNCDGPIDVVYSEVVVGPEPAMGSDRDCQGYSPIVEEDEEEWALFMNSSDYDATGSSNYFVVKAGSANWVVYPEMDGKESAMLTAIVCDPNDITSGFNVNVTFSNGVDWDAWQNQPFATDYKDDNNLATADELFKDWRYFILDDSETALIGYGDYAGSTLELRHAPHSKYFAFQEGVAANNRNGEYGIGGWFFFEGDLNYRGEVYPGIRGAGDFAFDLVCCPQYSIDRTWTATDCTGNVATYTQNISFDPSVPAEGEGTDGNVIDSNNGNDGEEDIDGNKVTIKSVSPNPTINSSQVVISVEGAQRVEVLILNAQGKAIQRLFDAQIESTGTRKIALDVSTLAEGMYFVCAVGSDNVDLEKIIVSK